MTWAVGAADSPQGMLCRSSSLVGKCWVFGVSSWLQTALQPQAGQWWPGDLTQSIHLGSCVLVSVLLLLSILLKISVHIDLKIISRGYFTKTKWCARTELLRPVPPAPPGWATKKICFLCHVTLLMPQSMICVAQSNSRQDDLCGKLLVRPGINHCPSQGCWKDAQICLMKVPGKEWFHEAADLSIAWARIPGGNDAGTIRVFSSNRGVSWQEKRLPFFL